jgi:hypothetical protein
MSKITPEQAQFISDAVYNRYSTEDTDDCWQSKETEFEFHAGDIAFDAWGWLFMEVQLGLKSWNRGDHISFIIDFDYIGIVTNKQDLEDGEKSLELHGSDCNICNCKF